MPPLKMKIICKNSFESPPDLDVLARAWFVANGTMAFPKCSVSAANMAKFLLEEWVDAGKPLQEHPSSELNALLGKALRQRLTKGNAVGIVGYYYLELMRSSKSAVSVGQAQVTLNRAAYLASEHIIRMELEQAIQDDRPRPSNLISDRKKLAQTFRNNLPAAHYWTSMIVSPSFSNFGVQQNLWKFISYAVAVRDVFLSNEVTEAYGQKMEPISNEVELERVQLLNSDAATDLTILDAYRNPNSFLTRAE